MSGARLWVVLGVAMALAGCLMLVAAQQGLDNRLSAMEERIVARIGERFVEVDRRLGEVNQRPGDIDNRLDRMEGFFEVFRQAE